MSGPLPPPPSNRPGFQPTTPYDVSFIISAELYAQIPHDESDPTLDLGDGTTRIVSVHIDSPQFVTARDVIEKLGNTLVVNTENIKIRLGDTVYSMSDQSSIDDRIDKILGKRPEGRGLYVDRNEGD